MFKLPRFQFATPAPCTTTNDSEFVVDLRAVVKTFETPAGPFTALKGVDLQIRSGEFVSVIGKSGSGKSTLINMITGIDRPSSGEVYVARAALHKLSEEQIAVWRRRAIGVVFQFFQLLPGLSAVENVLLPMDYCRRLPADQRPERALHLLKEMEIADQAHALPATLSGGQLQRVAIARALANDPPLITADEPTGNLDSRTAEVIFDLFTRLALAGKTVLMVTHDNQLARRAWRTIVIADGKIVEERINGQPAQQPAGILQ